MNKFLSSGKDKHMQSNVPPTGTLKRTNNILLFLNSGKGSWSFACISFLFYYLFSTLHTSFYQAEEGAHYMNMKSIWYDPRLVLGNWPKTGWKILYAIPVLFGREGVLITNCLFAAATIFFAAKVSRQYGSKWPFLTQVLLFSQPLWTLLAFKNYPEISTAFIITLSVYYATKNRFILSALLLSFSVLIRQEWLYLIAVYGVFLLYRKAFLACLALGIFPLLNILWGWALSGDIMYVIDLSKKTADLYKSMYPRHGIDHYIRMSELIFGAVCMIGFFIYLTQTFIQRSIKVAWFVITPLLYFVLAHSILNDKLLNWGPSTGGVLRYLLCVSPLFAVLATLAFEKMNSVNRKAVSLVLAIPFLAYCFIYMGFQHNWVKFHPEWGKNLVLPMLTLAIILVVYLSPPRFMQGLVAGLAFLQLVLLIKPRQLKDDENWAQREIVAWCKQNQLEKKGPILCTLALFNYFYDKNRWEFPLGNGIITPETIHSAKKGTYIIWDSHYAAQYGNVHISFFKKDPAKYKMLKELTSPARDIQIVVMEKL